MSSKLFLLFENIALFSVIFFQLETTVADSNNIIRCIDEEREALLTFKQSLVDEYGVLSSWGREDGKRDCCKWRGVRCSNTTGHVKVLNLRRSDDENARRMVLKGTISPALVKLHDLRHLDLSNNHFSGSPVPEFIGSLCKLRYLNLSCGTPSSKFLRPMRNRSGLVHPSLENSNLFSVGSLEWLSNLSSLRHLDLSYINLTKSSDWFQVVAKLCSLKTIVLSSCDLPPINPSFNWHFNMSTSIETLDLSDNDLPFSSVYPWLFNLSRNILHLDLGYNQLQGSIPRAFQRMVSLRYLSLLYNELEGGIPKFFGNMCSLNILNLGHNKLSGQLSEMIQNLYGGCTLNSLEDLGLYHNDITGPIPDLGGFSSLKILSLAENGLNGTINKSISQLLKLESLSLASNSFTGVITEILFSNMSNLQFLFLNDNSLTLKLGHDWVPPFQLKMLRLASCKMGPHFPKWLKTQNQLLEIDISNNGISDTVPDWFWDLSIELTLLDLSNNHIKGKLPDLCGFRSDDITIFIDSNHFEGTIPLLPSNSMFLDLSKNKFSGSITFLCSIGENTWNLFDLSDNLLSGELPDCWFHFDSLSILDLANNNFSGKIPDSISFLRSIKTLRLHNNRLAGELPSSLRNCSQLRVLDLAKNAFFGEIPTWIGGSLQNLIILNLKSNKFHGNIPFQLCHLGFIHVLDLSLNNISGKIPKCFNNFSAMIQERSSNPTIEFVDYIIVQKPFGAIIVHYFDNLQLTWKGSENEYKRTLGLLKCLDLSSNKLCGAIPEEIMDLDGLIALKLSRNNLSGPITPKIGQLKSLDFLDLSRNQFSGSIPSSLSQLSGLGVLDLSYNNLSGKIPLGTQLQSFNPSFYAGNLELCGLPLPNKCADEESTPSPGRDDDASTPEYEDDQFISLGFYVSLILGFFVGFWGVCGALMLNRSWRYGYFNFLTGMRDLLYVIAAVNIAKLQRKFRN